MKSDSMQILMCVLVLLGTVLSIASVSWCEQTNFTLTSLLGNRDVSFGMWRYKSFVLVGTSEGDLWRVETCRPYPGNIQKDSHWKAAQAFSIAAPIVGILAIGPIFAISRKPRLAKVSGLLFLLATLFQGLTLLILRSNLCDSYENPMFDEFPILQSAGALTTKDTCDLGRSGVVSIIAMCLWFVAGVAALAIPVEPVGAEK